MAVYTVSPYDAICRANEVGVAAIVPMCSTTMLPPTAARMQTPLGRPRVQARSSPANVGVARTPPGRENGAINLAGGYE